MVPLTLELDGNEERIEVEVPDVNEELLFGVRRQKASSLDIKVFKFHETTPKASLKFGLAYRMENNKATFTSEPNKSMFNVMEGHGMHSVVA
ncbi:hypothetical protein [Shewanella sp. YIC-542]|uniref:hypothetical protein n=1 Tax=Shewanella mytili TaxID=3377111 RepID=UPI00398F0587